MKHTLLYIGLALASFMMQPAAVQAKAKKEAKEVSATAKYAAHRMSKITTISDNRLASSISDLTLSIQGV